METARKKERKRERLSGIQTDKRENALKKSETGLQKKKKNNKKKKKKQIIKKARKKEKEKKKKTCKTNTKTTL